MAVAGVHIDDPVFELNGPLGRIDLSAWISGLSFSAGLYISNFDHVAAAVAAEAGLVMLAAWAVFFASILLIQRHMRFSLRATTYGQPQHLVTDGIFRYSRNPIYVAFLIPLASIAVISPFAAAAAIILYVGGMNATIIRTEERHLLEKFGDTYARYLARAPRWFLFN